MAVKHVVYYVDCDNVAIYTQVFTDDVGRLYRLTNGDESKFALDDKLSVFKYL